MAQPFTRSLGFLKTTALGGALFLLPLIVIGALLGKVAEIVLAVAKVLADNLPIESARGWAILVALAIAIILAACFFAGLAAEWTFGKRFSGWLEKNLLLLFPRYLIVKAQMAGTLNDAKTKQKIKPVLVQLDDMQRVAFEVDRSPSGQVAVYLPGSPDPWSGSVAYVEAARVRPMSIEFSEALATCEQMGRDSAQIVAAPTAD
jgi:uncharacterized membrane protein